MNARDEALAAAVAEHGPFPMPTGTNPGEVLAEVVAAAIRTHDNDAWDGAQIDALRAGLFEYRDRAEAPVPAAEVDRLRARVAELEAVKPARYQDCPVCGAGYEYGQPCSMCEFKKRIAAERTAQTEHPHTWVTALDGDDRPALDNTGHTWEHCGICGQRKADTTENVAPQVEKLRTILAPSPEDPHDSPLHRRYETGHDLPPVTS